ncbi:cytochrome b5-like heme/steroid binding domain-containing protein [Kocuria sp.]|uniref:cytochrome b5-like heme/steroid binding domain-containing protein n=1 Tax=Kocuria sp. TaxID=1871328 RepID=UPI0026DEFCED|nr:cytochrome b5-like heme/steroid binding domain-containing protein [Kocuria sp.]MDO5617221.1 cytochrome b5-like heme/steroid binding domain-containing protein [Kocuria sp.]
MHIQLPFESSVFSSVGDLPLHPLVVHIAVVLLPLSALMLLLAAFVPAVRRRFLGLGVIGAIIGVAATYISKESGEALAQTVGEPQSHAQWGDRLMVVSVIFLVLAVVWWTVARRSTARAATADSSASRSGGGLAAILGFITAALSVAVIVLAVLTGHSGAQAVWGGTVGAATSSSTDDAASASAVSQPATADATASSATAAGYTMSDVEEHSSSSDCWAAVDNNVYDLTDWIAQHPGGQSAITGLCGTDATDAFARQHGNNDEAKAALAEHQIGTLNS